VELIARADALSGAVETGPAGGDQEAPATSSVDGQDVSGFNMANELSFAWNLAQEDLLTQEEYAEVVQDLTEMMASEIVATVSVLHALEARGSKKLEPVMAAVAKKTGIPVISLASFDLNTKALPLLPLEMMIRRGVLAFDLLNKDALVVLMNPHDEQLRKDVEAVSRRKCHYYLTLPSEFDQAITRAQDLLSKPGEGE
jgi:hypothetical protein